MIALSPLLSTKLFRRDGYFVGKFQAMGSPCEILLETDNDVQAAELFAQAVNEAYRIERKWSRYDPDSIVHQINTRAGQLVRVDDETAALLSFAQQCTKLSNGLFDITSGVLRRAWNFKDPSVTPRHAEIDALLELVGWGKVFWNGTSIRLLPGMEIDFGGLGKEYAVDKSAELLRQASAISVLINFGGDIGVTQPRIDGQPWMVGIENVEQEGQAVKLLQLKEGAIATSGDSKRFVWVDGKRRGHILDPRTGWPVEGAPRSVTVAARTCTEAGFLSTWAMLNGKDAEQFLKTPGIQSWCLR